MELELPEITQPPDLTTYLEHCRYCPAWIYWTRTNTGAWMPVDRDPTEDGDIRLKWTPYELQAHVLTKDELSDVDRETDPLRKTHFATCPKADEARRKHRGETSPAVHTTTTKDVVP